MVPNLRHFVFAPNFATRQIRGCWFQIWHNYFQLPASKYANLAFLVTNLKIFVFAPNFATRRIRGCWFQTATADLNCSPKYPNNAFLVSDLRILVLFLYETLQLDKLEGFDYKSDNGFSTFQPKDQKWSIFAPIFLYKYIYIYIYIYWMEIYSFTIDGCRLKSWRQFLVNCSPKIPKWGIFVQKFKVFLFLDETLHANKFDDADFKYGISFLEFQPKIRN